MPNEFAAPIDHTTASAAATVASGTASGAIQGAAKGWWKGIKTLAIVGGIIGLVCASFGTGLIALPVALTTAAAPTAGAAAHFVLPAIVGQLFTIASTAAIFSAIGGGLGVLAGYITAPIGGLIGAAKGVSKASERVSNERGSAAVLQAQIEAYKLQAAAQNTPATTNVYATSATNDNKFGFAEQGSALNPAQAQLQAGNDNRQYLGAVNGQELATVR